MTLALKVGLVACVAAVLGVLVPMAYAEAQTNTFGDFRPCEEERPIDVLLLMDESGSLNSASGADPDGVQRTRALQQIRHDLSEYTDVRVALIGFDTEPKLHAPMFMPASSTYPSDAQIEASLGDRGNTDYEVALNAAIEVFEGSKRPDACRVLVWFTDGIHDDTFGRTLVERQEAIAFRDTLCDTVRPDSIKNQFEQLGIKTYAVLLGNAFQEGLSSEEHHQRVMAEVSMDVIRAMTGNRDSPLASQVPVSESCAEWVDDLSDQDGEIITVEKVSDLVNKLLEVVNSATGLFKWSDCDIFPDSTTVRSMKLPAGSYIDRIHIYVYDGAILEYSLNDDTQTGWQSFPSGSQERLILDASDLRDLPAGWELEMGVIPDNLTVQPHLSCYAAPIDTLLQMTGRIVNSQGDYITKLLDDRNYIFEVDTGDYECPIDAGRFVLTPDNPPGASMISNAGCELGSIEMFPYDTDQLASDTAVASFHGTMTPRYADNLWPDEASAMSVEVDTDFEILVTDVAGPKLHDCDSIGARIIGEYPGRLVIAEDCDLIPPRSGSGSVSISDQINSDPDLDWQIIDSNGLEVPSPIVAGDTVVEDIDIEALLPEGDHFIVDGESTIIIEWLPEDGLPTPPEEMTVRLNGLDRLSARHLSDQPRFACSDDDVTIVNVGNDGEVPEGTLKAGADCDVLAPSVGQLRVTLSNVPDTNWPSDLNWRFALDEVPQSRITDEGHLLVLSQRDYLQRIEFITSDALENTRWSGYGELILEAVWYPSQDVADSRLVATQSLGVELDLLARSDSRKALLLAGLMALSAAAVTYACLYYALIRLNRLPSANDFYAVMKEFRAHKNEIGKLTSQEVVEFNPNDLEVQRVEGDLSRGKWLGFRDLRIDLKHAPWWNVASLLKGSWGVPRRRSRGNRMIFTTSPPGPKKGTTSTYFSELTVIGLEVAESKSNPSGVLYTLSPRSARVRGRQGTSRGLPGRGLDQLLAELTDRYDQSAESTDGDSNSDMSNESGTSVENMHPLGSSGVSRGSDAPLRRSRGDDAPPPRFPHGSSGVSRGGGVSRGDDAPVRRSPDDAPPPRFPHGSSGVSPGDTPPLRRSRGDDAPPRRRPRGGGVSPDDVLPPRRGYW